MVPDIKSMYSSLSAEGFSAGEMDTVIKDDGQHAEWFWAREFPGAFIWLFGNTFIPVESIEPDSIFNVTPNPAQSRIYLYSKYPMKKIQVEIINDRGEKIFSSEQLFSKPIDVSSLKTGWYFLKVNDRNKTYSKIFEVMR